MEHPINKISAPLGSPVVLTCSVSCAQSQNCRIEWRRRQLQSAANRPRHIYLEVPSIYYGNKGLLYPTYTYNYTLNSGYRKIETKLVIQQLTQEYTGKYKCRAVNGHRAISSPQVKVSVKKVIFGGVY